MGVGATQNHREHLYTRGRELLRSGDFRRAEYLLWDMVSGAPGAPTSTLVLGVSILLQGRFEEARRLVDRAYDLKLSVFDEIVAPSMSEMLQGAAVAIPNWLWPQYQLARNKFDHCADLLLAAFHHREGYSSDQPERAIHFSEENQISELARLSDTQLKSRKIDLVSAHYRELPIKSRLAMTKKLQDSKFAWVFSGPQVFAMRKELL